MAKVDRNDPLGFGVSIVTDFSRNVKRSSGVVRVMEAVIGILLDRLWYAPEYGIDLPRRILSQDSRTYPGLAAETERAILTDERVETAQVRIDPPDGDGNVLVTVTGTAVTGEELPPIKGVAQLVTGDFRFTR